MSEREKQIWRKTVTDKIERMRITKREKETLLCSQIPAEVNLLQFVVLRKHKILNIHDTHAHRDTHCSRHLIYREGERGREKTLKKEKI